MGIFLSYSFLLIQFKGSGWISTLHFGNDAYEVKKEIISTQDNVTNTIVPSVNVT